MSWEPQPEELVEVRVGPFDVDPEAIDERDIEPDGRLSHRWYRGVVMRECTDAAARWPSQRRWLVWVPARDTQARVPAGELRQVPAVDRLGDLAREP